MPRKPAHVLSLQDIQTLEEAINQLSDAINMATGDIGPECGVSVIDQVEDTREAMADAGKVLTKWRRKAARAAQA